jgi:hypothetical protein
MWIGGAYSLAHLNLPGVSYLECLSRGEMCTAALAGADVQMVGIQDHPRIGPAIHAGSRCACAVLRLGVKATEELISAAGDIAVGLEDPTKGRHEPCGRGC